ncbi:MAG: hypothetical protein ACYTG7_02380 [Planctomycetota bacterium]
MIHRMIQGKVGPVSLLFLTLIGAAGFSAFYLNKMYREKELEIERLNQVVDRLEASSRVAQVVVKEQGTNPDTGKLETTVKFVEQDREGRTLPERLFTVEGDVIYFDTLVIKFERDYVERGEALRGKSIHLFRRVFGETQPPEMGESIDASSIDRGVPNIYRVSDTPSEFEADLWENFWWYATHPEMAKEKGVRVMQGEAVYTRFIRDNLYTLTLDHDGGINIETEPIPSILRESIQAQD